MIWLTQLDLNSSYVMHILPSFIAMSLGHGPVFVPLSSTALSGVAEHDAGVASAMVNTTQQVGGSLGTALLNTIFTTAVAASPWRTGVARSSRRTAAIHGYNVAFTVSAVLLAVGAVLVVPVHPQAGRGRIGRRCGAGVPGAGRRPLTIR